MSPRKKVPDKVWVSPNPLWKGDAVKYDLPYFAHEQLDPAIYPYAVGKPVLRAFQLKMDAQTVHDSEFDLDSSSGDEPFTPRHKTSDQSVFKGDNRTLASHDKDSAKKLKINGGQAATAKKVSWELDSCDEIIVSMKEAGRTEKEIAERLIGEGRVRYHPKTIGTRWARLKRAQQAHQDDLMDAELTDWHEGDDDALQRAIAKADEDMEIAKAKLDAKKWKLVSDNMKAIKPVTNFSQRACRERTEALLAGTAKIPPELIEDKTADILQRIQSRSNKEQKLLALKGKEFDASPGSNGHKSITGPPAKKRRVESPERTLIRAGRSTAGRFTSTMSPRPNGKGSKHVKKSSISSTDGVNEWMADEWDDESNESSSISDGWTTTDYWTATLPLCPKPNDSDYVKIPFINCMDGASDESEESEESEGGFQLARRTTGGLRLPTPAPHPKPDESDYAPSTSSMTSSMNGTSVEMLDEFEELSPTARRMTSGLGPPTPALPPGVEGPNHAKNISINSTESLSDMMSVRANDGYEPLTRAGSRVWSFDLRPRTKHAKKRSFGSTGDGDDEMEDETYGAPAARFSKEKNFSLRPGNKRVKHNSSSSLDGADDEKNDETYEGPEGSAFRVVALRPYLKTNVIMHGKKPSIAEEAPKTFHDGKDHYDTETFINESSSPIASQGSLYEPDEDEA